MSRYYFDNAATSWPKPRSVPRAMHRFSVRCGGNPGRSGHRKAIDAGRTVLQARESMAELFNAADPAHLVFTKNATEALNLALLGSLRGGDHVVTGSMEHNSVLRPLDHLAGSGVEVSIVAADSRGRLDPESVFGAVKANTRLVAVCHASNVTGTVQEVEPIGAFCRQRSILFLVDAAQTAGCLPVDVQRLQVDLLAFSGHKGLLGPQGTGGLYIRDEQVLSPLMRGGTGSLSDRESQPEFLPDRFESGTLNVPGLAGLAAGAAFLLRRSVERVAVHERRLLEIFLGELSGNPRISIYGMSDPTRQTGVLSLNVAGFSPSELGQALEKRFGLLTRIGLHCAPRAHRTLGTFPDGTVRLSWGVFTRERDVRAAARAVQALARER